MNSKSRRRAQTRSPARTAQRNGRYTHDRVLVIIGGREDKERERVILKEVARRVGNGKLVISTVASSEPDGLYETYAQVFRQLGVKNTAELEIRTRDDALKEQNLEIVKGAAGFFFTGGDQLKITSQLGATPIYEELRRMYKAGKVIAGTSAGASVVTDTMLASGEAGESHRVSHTLQMAPGLGFVRGMIVDQHFAERGRLGRLLGAVAQNPKTLGVGIDEDTAIVVTNGEQFYVVGSGAVYVLDARRVTYSNITEAQSEETLSIHNLKVHVLSCGDGYDLRTREPSRARQRECA